jgi:hypothetical protein
VHSCSCAVLLVPHQHPTTIGELYSENPLGSICDERICTRIWIWSRVSYNDHGTSMNLRRGYERVPINIKLACEFEV